MTLEQQADVMNRIPFVRWDRTVRYEDGTDSVYGWIDRPDGRSDFVLLILYDTGAIWGFSSNAERSQEITRLLSGEADAEHIECQRIENVYGDLVTNVIKL